MAPDHQPKKKIVIIGSSSADLSYIVPENILEDARFKALTAVCKKFSERIEKIEGTKDIAPGVLSQIFEAHSASVEEVLNKSLLLDDIKATCSNHSSMPGGGGYNVAKNLQILTSRLGIDAEITLITKLGPERAYDPSLGKQTLNIGAQKVRSAMQDQDGYMHLIDIAADDPNYRTPVNAVLLTPEGRSILKAPETGLTSASGNGAPSYASRIYSDVTHAIADADFVVIQASKFPFIAAHAAQVAAQRGVPVLVDYDVSSSENLHKAAELLEHATYVVAPHDAIAPPRMDGDDADLFTKLVQTDGRYHSHLTAVSDGIRPIAVNTAFHDFYLDVPMKELSVVDKNGAGDLRDAAMAYALIAGYNPLEALRFGSAFSSFGTHYQGRQWADHIGEFFTLYQQYKTQAGLNGQTGLQAFTPHSPAV